MRRLPSAVIRFGTIQAPEVSRGTGSVACGYCGAVGPFGESYLVAIEAYTAEPDALVEPCTLFACSPEHAERVLEGDDGELPDEEYEYEELADTLMRLPSSAGEGNVSAVSQEQSCE